MRTFDEAYAELVLMKYRIPNGTRYMHIKTGNMYTVRNIELNEADLTVVVAYVGDLLPSVRWVRPVIEFNKKFQVVDK